REKLLPVEAPPPPAARRRRTLALVAAAAVLAAGGATAASLVARSQRRAEEARNAVALATKGLARDTEGALREAARVLAAAGAGPARPDAAGVAVEVNALLAHDFADPDARARAAALLASGAAGDGAPAARALLAEGGERAAAEEALLHGGPATTPLGHAVAGDVLLGRRDFAAAREHLDAAARATPPLLRAFAALGELELAQGAPERALERFDAALRAHATHPRSTVGAAEARLALGRELPDALRSLEAVEADAASAPPVALRLRFD